METSKELVRYDFTAQERVDLAVEQTRHWNGIRSAEEELGSIKADYKHRISVLEADMSRCAGKVTAGYEMREVRCLLLKFRPDNDSMLIVRTDNGRVMKRRRMNSDERQLVMTTEPPELMEYETDFYEDTSSDIAELTAENVPLTAKEAKELTEALGPKIRKLMKKLEAGPQ